MIMCIFVRSELQAVVCEKKIRRKGRSKYLVLFFGFVVLYKYVSGRQINILSPVSTLQHVEERKIYLNRALLVLFSITLKLQKKVKEREEG